MLKFITFWLVSPWEEREEKRSLPITQEQRVWPMWSDADHNNDQKRKKPTHIHGALPVCWTLLEELDLCDEILFM